MNARIIELIKAEGADAWFTRPVSDFLGEHDPERFEKVEDILDVIAKVTGEPWDLGEYARAAPRPL